MNSFLRAASLLLFDLASTLLFLAVLSTTRDLPMAILSGLGFGCVQIVWLRFRGTTIETMHWLSFALVLGSGGVALITSDPRIVMFKPSLILCLVGTAMLKRGWMLRYLTPDVKGLLGDIALVFGYVWAGLMLFSAVLNAVLAVALAPQHWALVMSVYGLTSKLGLFLIQFGTMKILGCLRRQRYAREKDLR